MSLFPVSIYRWRFSFTSLICFKKSWFGLFVYWPLCCVSLHKARCSVPSDLPLCGWYVPRRRWPSSPQGIPANVPESPSSRCAGGFDHVWENGAGSRTQLWRNLQELCLPRDKGFNREANTGLCHAHTQAGPRRFLKHELVIHSSAMGSESSWFFLGYAGPHQACHAHAASKTWSASRAAFCFKQVSYQHRMLHTQ